MSYYVARGQLPPKKHTQFRSPGNELYCEEVFGTCGFSGIASILYHLHPPTVMREITGMTPLEYAAEPAGALHHRHFFTGRIATEGDLVSSRRYLLKNDDVLVGVGETAKSMTAFYRNSDGDELLFVQDGSGVLHSPFGDLAVAPGDYVVIPSGMLYRMEIQERMRFIVFEAYGPIELPSRYLNSAGQISEQAPFSERDFHVPEGADPVDESGEFVVQVKKRDRVSTYVYAHHPFDVVGWDGYLYPYTFNISDFQPMTGAIHLPPTIHQTFQGPNIAICSFVPRLFDYHPRAVPVSYFHSNIDTDEVLYYVRGNFMSRRGIESGSLTLHPAGIPHGPQPGAIEASLGKSSTDELAVMMDAFRPLTVLRPANSVEDDNYTFSWQ